MSRRTRIAFIAIACLLTVPMAAYAGDRFTDVPNDNVFHDDITWLADAKVTLGCNPPANDEFCPKDNVTREQMAAFMRRLAANKVVEAATAVDADHATTADSAGNAETLGGMTPAEMFDVFDQPSVPAHGRSTYVPSTTNGTTNGRALRDAVAAIDGDGRWRIELQAGTYDLGTAQLVLPANVSVIGAGADATVIQASRGAAGPSAGAAVIVGANGTVLEDLQVTNTNVTSGVVVGVYSEANIVVRRAALGQNANAGNAPDSYGLVAGGFSAVEDSNLLGFSGGTGVGVGLYTRAGSRITNSVLHTQGGANGAAIVTDAATTGAVSVKETQFRGFGSGRGFIHNGSGTMTILFSEFVQGGADGLITNGTVNIGASMRSKAITVSGGSVACANNFTATMAAIGC